MCIQSENYGDFRRMCNPHHNYVHFTGGKLRHGDSPHFLWGKHLQCTSPRAILLHSSLLGRANIFVLSLFAKHPDYDIKKQMLDFFFKS